MSPYDLRVPPPRRAGGSRPEPLLALLARVTPLLVRGSARRAIRRPAAVDRALALRVADVTTEAEGVVGLRLVRADGDGAPLPGWRPGAHLDLDLPSGRRRQYSLCGDPADRDVYRVAVRLVPDGEGGSREMHSLTPGAVLRTLGPRNAFPLALTGTGSLLFVAGGIGITPILPMVRAAAVAGADWRLVYAGRDRASLPYLDELTELAASEPARLRVRSDAEAGGPPSAAELLAGAGPDTAVYFCGPPALIPALRSAPVLHLERFSPPPITDGTAFEIQLGRGGAVLPVPADRTALSVLSAARPATAYSCRQGFCGTCRLDVLSGAGSVRHHGSAAARRTDDAMLVCVSRAEAGARLVLDV
ncbi:PDR/VanB family oxidoreductase [Streptomyces sp. NPDC058691]|uniref:PDR/VanB family oxidoreductase n=1 Tax=Streptomyces sp. NPDC058691 TaxID=3346601 RepID=UPI003668938F